MNAYTITVHTPHRGNVRLFIAGVPGPLQALDRAQEWASSQKGYITELETLAQGGILSDGDKEYVTYDLFEFDTGGDAGIGCYMTCPTCHERIQLAASPWWDTECQCGIKWELDIRAVGRKRQNDDLTGEDARP